MPGGREAVNFHLVPDLTEVLPNVLLPCLTMESFWLERTTKVPGLAWRVTRRVFVLSLYDDKMIKRFQDALVKILKKK